MPTPMNDLVTRNMALKSPICLVCVLAESGDLQVSFVERAVLRILDARGEPGILRSLAIVNDRMFIRENVFGMEVLVSLKLFGI